MEPSTRERILRLLQRSPNLTTSELASALHVTRHDVRYHLKDLLRQGFLTLMPAKSTASSPSPGRPAMAFQLSEKARPDMLASLADALLDMGLSSTASQDFVAELSSRLFPHSAVDNPPAHFPVHLNQVIETINQYPYQARWEAHKSGPRVVFSNCPYAAIIQDHPELCHVDCRMLEKYTGLSVKQTEKMGFSHTASTTCVFLLQQLPE